MALASKLRVAVAAFGSLLAQPLGPALGDDTIVVTLKGDTFTPAEVKIPAGKAVTLKFVNQEPVAAEIEAKDLKIEKVVGANSEIIVNLAAQEAGRYLFVNEYKEDVAKGFIVVE